MKHNPKHILHVVNIYFVLPYFIGGQFRHFANKGYKMFAACSKSEYLENYAKENGFQYLETPVCRSVSISNDLKSIRNVYRYIRKNQIGIVVGHTPKGALIAMVASWLARVPKRIYFRHGLVYETSHGLKRFILISVDRLASALATKVVCVSPSVMRRSIEDKLCPASKMIILSKGTCNGIDTLGKFNPANINAEKLAVLKNKYGIKESDWVIGYTGRLVRDKGIIELVRALDYLKGQNYKLLLMGMFEQRDALPEDVQQKILHDERVVYTGFINENQEYFYAMMNVYVLPSYREGFPTGCLEAQSMGIPVITTTSTGCIDAIQDGVTGLRTKIDAVDIATQIATVREKHLDTGMSSEARKWVMDNFEEHHIWDEVEQLYL
ncbi:MAG: glycosyltransferase [Prevotella sp.]|jgi:glycosyltransferase involved in cell wall biosynthesis